MRIKVLLLSWLAVGSAAQAEALRVEDYTPARSDAYVLLRDVGVDSLGGNVGMAMAVAIEDRLRTIEFGQGPWFRVIPVSLGAGSDAIFRGTADIDVERFDFSETRERCVKDAQGKCTKQREKYQVKCVRREISLETRLRLIGRNGDLLWSEDSAEPLSEKRCQDDSDDFRSPGQVERQLIGRVLMRIEADMVPRRSQIDVRVDENRRALQKGDAELFKRAVRHIKDGQPSQACALWNQLAERNPAHLPTRFNLGLCAEFAGRETEARANYRQALELGMNHAGAKAGLARLDRRERALSQLKMRNAG
jgi:tetratricopeptide (TPR) repeat protein